MKDTYYIQVCITEIKTKNNGVVKVKNFSENQVSNYTVGDKVTVVTKNEFSEKYQTGQGTIIKITPKTVTVRQYKQKTKGWIVRVGSTMQLIEGWDVKPENYVHEIETIETHKKDEFNFVGNLDSGLLKVFYNDKLVDEVFYWKIKTEFMNECEKWFKYHSEDVRTKKMYNT